MRYKQEMEEDLHRSQTAHVEERVQERLKRAIDKAEEQIDYEAAHNKELLRALEIVEKFLKTSGRVCYGGTAMNAILPAHKRFYDPETDLPDYDFFTPDIEADTDAIVQALKEGGFKDVYHRVGMHEGTRKILVNFVPIADISQLSPHIYAALQKRSILRGGLRYVDPDILRMMMYLELSRPKGEVARWEKVYERLQLINSNFKPKRLSGTRAKRGSAIPKDIFKTILDFCVSLQRPLMSGNLGKFYEGVVNGEKRAFLVENHPGPVVFLSSDVREDAKALQEKLGGDSQTKGIFHAARGDLVPEYVEIRQRGTTVAIIFQETACHSFLNFPLQDGRSVAIASMDTLITLYYAIGIFTKQAKVLMKSALADLPDLVRLVELNRTLRKPHIPAFPLTCSGYQKGYATLLREKVERIRRERNRQTRKTKKKGN